MLLALRILTVWLLSTVVAFLLRTLLLSLKLLLTLFLLLLLFFLLLLLTFFLLLLLLLQWRLLFSLLRRLLVAAISLITRFVLFCRRLAAFLIGLVGSFWSVYCAAFGGVTTSTTAAAANHEYSTDRDKPVDDQVSDRFIV